MPLQRKDVKKLIALTLNARPTEIGCDECLDTLPQFVEKTLVGKEVAEALRLVKEHLQGCGECHAEYTALLEALRAISSELQ